MTVYRGRGDSPDVGILVQVDSPDVVVEVEDSPDVVIEVEVTHQTW